MTQNSLLEYQPSIEASYSHADIDWKQEATAAVNILIKIGDDFTSEKVIELLERRGATTGDLRALGYVFQSFSKKGLIRFIRYTKATRRQRHGAPISLWRPMSRLASV